MSVTIGSLFAGIGGLELGLEWAGLGPVLWQCEQDEFCRVAAVWEFQQTTLRIERQLRRKLAKLRGKGKQKR